MKETKTLVVAGTFDDVGGKKSGVIEKLFENYPVPAHIVNGGSYSEIRELLESVINYDVVYWFANVDNRLPKLRNVKEINPRCILINSKRNFDNKYCFAELVNRGLEVKANLTFEFSKTSADTDGLIHVMVFDPLGVAWCPRTSNLDEAMQKAYARVEQLKSFTRQGSINLSETMNFEVEQRFIDIIHEKAEIFHELIQPEATVKRFLGNCSFRCVNGFPSFRGNNCIVVSRRNVNKSGITNNDFVAVRLDNDKLYAYGPNKPSVDTPIQARLYSLLHNINYMMHSHVYVKDAPFTSAAIPCGALEEVDSIMKTIEKNHIDTSKSFCINLLGHGNTVFATSLDYFDTIEYIKRDAPEIL